MEGEAGGSAAPPALPRGQRLPRRPPASLGPSPAAAPRPALPSPAPGRAPPPAALPSLPAQRPPAPGEIPRLHGESQPSAPVLSRRCSKTSPSRAPAPRVPPAGTAPALLPPGASPGDPGPVPVPVPGPVPVPVPVPGSVPVPVPVPGPVPVPVPGPVPRAAAGEPPGRPRSPHDNLRNACPARGGPIPVRRVRNVKLAVTQSLVSDENILKGISESQHLKVSFDARDGAAILPSIITPPKPKLFALCQRV